jgi:hypothetical protein
MLNPMWVKIHRYLDTLNNKMSMKNISLLCFLILFLMIGLIHGGDVTVTLVGIDTLTINIKGDTQNEEAGNISIYLYFRDDSLTDLEESGVDVTQITGNAPGQFGWPTRFQKMEVRGEGQQPGGGPWIRAGHTFTKRLFYDNADIGVQDDFWTIAGINAIVGTFTAVGNGHAFIELAGSDGLADFNGIPHNVSYVNQEIPLPVKQPITSEFPGSGLVNTKLVIYNSLGQAIKTLYQDKLSAGSYEVQWDGRTDFGDNASSGIYFAIFKAGGYSQTGKLLLLK